jgi:hypothetical protein
MGSDRGKTIQRLSENSVGSVDITGDPRVKAMAECLTFIHDQLATRIGQPIVTHLGEEKVLIDWVKEVLEGAGFEVNP